jgi:hypothetical protein
MNEDGIISIHIIKIIYIEHKIITPNIINKEEYIY